MLRRNLCRLRYGRTLIPAAEKPFSPVQAPARVVDWSPVIRCTEAMFQREKEWHGATFSLPDFLDGCEVALTSVCAAFDDYLKKDEDTALRQILGDELFENVRTAVNKMNEKERAVLPSGKDADKLFYIAIQEIRRGPRKVVKETKKGKDQEEDEKPTGNVQVDVVYWFDPDHRRTQYFWTFEYEGEHWTLRSLHTIPENNPTQLFQTGLLVAYAVFSILTAIIVFGSIFK
eukprot:TRINITY_DN18215_c0_g1_i1.p1 TRINITY_DN18215_c0_g1~~TRINITY_DN18215_c0_g1_i1.p1  ORF type:complete len:240 (-),score=43.22 TRINITY_DN18215_c0_g1_i1:921-1613(-)